MSNSNIKRMIKASQNEAWSKKRISRLKVLQYAGGIVMVFSMMAMDGSVFGYQISVDRDLLVILLVVGTAEMCEGHSKRKMIELVKEMKDIKQKELLSG